MTETNFTFRVEEKLKSEFTAVAKANDRPASLLLRDFMRDYIRQAQEQGQHDAWFRAEVAEGLREADDPAVAKIPHETVKRDMQRQRKAIEARAAKQTP